MLDGSVDFCGVGIIESQYLTSYLVVIQASRCLIPLSGRNPGFMVFGEIKILSDRNPGFITCIKDIPLSGRNPGFVVSMAAIWANTSFKITCCAIIQS